MKPQVVPHTHHPFLDPLRLDELRDTVERMPNRLLDQHVRPSLNCRLGRLDMQARRIRHDDQIGRRCESSLQIVHDGCVDAERLRLWRMRLSADPHLEAESREVARVPPPDRPQADDQRAHYVAPTRFARSSSASARSTGVSMSIASRASTTSPTTRWPIMTRCSRMTSRRVTS